MHYLNRQKQGIGSDNKPPLAPQTPAGPASKATSIIEGDENTSHSEERVRTIGIPGLRSYLQTNKNTTLSNLSQSEDRSTVNETRSSFTTPTKSRIEPQDRQASFTPSNNLPSIFVDQHGAENLAKSIPKIKLKKATASAISLHDNTTHLPGLNTSKSATVLGTTIGGLNKSQMMFGKTRSSMLGGD